MQVTSDFTSVQGFWNLETQSASAIQLIKSMIHKVEQK